MRIARIAVHLDNRYVDCKQEVPMIKENDGEMFLNNYLSIPFVLATKKFVSRQELIFTLFSVSHNQYKIYIMKSQKSPTLEKN